jgi:hypothetical protein
MIGIAIPPVANPVTSGDTLGAIIATIALAFVAVVLLGLAVWGARPIRRSTVAVAPPADLPRAA